MKAIILAAGYRRDAINRVSTLLQKDLSTALLPIRGRPAIEFLLEKIHVVQCVEEIFIVVNQRFFSPFQAWLDDYVQHLPIRLINNGVRSQKDSPGAAGDLALVIEKHHIHDDVIIVGADNIFSFSLADFIQDAFRKKPFPLIAIYELNAKQKLKRYGIVKVDESQRVVDFCEKPPRHNGSKLIHSMAPNPAINGGDKSTTSVFLRLAQDASSFGRLRTNTERRRMCSKDAEQRRSTTLSLTRSASKVLISTCLYFLPKEKLSTIEQYLSLNMNGCAIGDYIKWLSQNDAVFAFEGKGDWFDIGDGDSYAEAIFKF